MHFLLFGFQSDISVVTTCNVAHIQLFWAHFLFYRFCLIKRSKFTLKRSFRTICVCFYFGVAVSGTNLFPYCTDRLLSRRHVCVGGWVIGWLAGCYLAFSSRRLIEMLFMASSFFQIRSSNGLFGLIEAIWTRNEINSLPKQFRKIAFNVPNIV